MLQPQRALNVKAAQVCTRNQGRARVEMRRGKAAINIVLVAIIQRFQRLVLQGGRFRYRLRRRNYLRVGDAAQNQPNTHTQKDGGPHFRAATPIAFNQTSAELYTGNP